MDDEATTPEADILPDELFDKHMGGPASQGDDPDEPAANDVTDDDFGDEDTPDEGPDDFDDDDFDDDEEGGDEEPDDELEDDEDDDWEDDDEEEESLDDDEEEDVLDGHVTAEDHERIKADPSLRKVHREMQRAFTKKTTAVREKEAAVEQRETRINQFEETIGSPSGMSQYLSRMMGERPDIAASAFEAVATGEHAEDFLVEVGLAHPEVLEAAYDRYHALQDDPQALEAHTRTRELKAKEAEIRRREEVNHQTTFTRQYGELTAHAERAAAKAGIPESDMSEVTDRLKAAVRSAVRKDGSIALEKKDVRRMVAEAKKAIDRVEQRVRSRLEDKQVKESQRTAKKKAVRTKGRRTRVPPKSPSRKGRKPARFKAPATGDPLDAFVEHALGG